MFFFSFFMWFANFQILICEPQSIGASFLYSVDILPGIPLGPKTTTASLKTPLELSQLNKNHWNVWFCPIFVDHLELRSERKIFVENWLEKEKVSYYQKKIYIAFNFVSLC